MWHKKNFIATLSFFVAFAVFTLPFTHLNQRLCQRMKKIKRHAVAFWEV